jgi:hypothetical protein
MDTSLGHSVYHKVLRVSATIFAAVLLFQSGFFTPLTAQLSNRTGQYLATAVGVSVGVPENDTNRLTTRIAELEAQVGASETQLRERNLETGLNTGFGGSATTTYLLSAILFIMLVLIVLNYALDFYRSRQELYDTKPTTTSVA